ncbi:MAG: PBP1A family penicillin-binding protein [Alphaproteobacteria bacterium]|nr:PBP1A family penicillin-binding protein [Alphaproteobacteria bacterium]MBQ8677697.1 PBP1A family penicillin-binding protein [Alphaproteobacteria bacterium]
MAKKTKTKKKTPKRKKRVTKQRGKIFKWLLISCFWLFIVLVIYVGYCYVTMPNIEQAIHRTRQPSTTITAENGNEIQSFGSVYSSIIMPDDLPKYVSQAIVATEDRRFYEHFGFDIISFTRAMIINVMHRRYVQGGSTITQQVAKNLFLTSQKNIKRKVQELLLAFWLEHKFTKDQILALYMNRVYLGNGTYGIESAANKYFQKTSNDLNLREAAILAGMLKAPSRYNPIASKERANQRAKIVLQNMVNAGLITSKQMAQALTMRLGPEISDKVLGGKHFADWVYQDVNAILGEREEDVYVHTTLDQDIQEKAEKILDEAILANRNKNVTQGAIVVMDKDGAVRAMVGGVGYEKSQFNRAVSALRQPGSAFKPFVYLTALQQGFTPNDKVMDSPIQIGKWRPENIDKQYHGEVTLKEALRQSYNLATIDLAERVGRRSIIANAKKMGITTPLVNDATLSLGTSEVRVLDMAAAYASLANGGYAVWPYGILEIFSRDGYERYMRQADEPRRILDAQSVLSLSKMLEEVINTGTGKRARLPFFAAGKTGTSQDFRDAWFAGFTGKYVCVVWVGNDNNSPMRGITGGTLPAEIWRRVMLECAK